MQVLEKDEVERGVHHGQPGLKPDVLSKHPRMAKTDREAQKEINRTQIEDQNLQRGQRRIADYKTADYLRDAVEQGDEKGPGKSIQGISASGQRKIPTIPKHSRINQKQGSQRQPDIDRRLPEK